MEFRGWDNIRATPAVGLDGEGPCGSLHHSQLSCKGREGSGYLRGRPGFRLIFYRDVLRWILPPPRRVRKSGLRVYPEVQKSFV